MVFRFRWENLYLQIWTIAKKNANSQENIYFLNGNVVRDEKEKLSVWKKGRYDNRKGTLITCRVDHFSYTDWMHKMNLSSSFSILFSLKLLSFWIMLKVQSHTLCATCMVRDFAYSFNIYMVHMAYITSCYITTEITNSYWAMLTWTRFFSNKKKHPLSVPCIMVSIPSRHVMNVYLKPLPTKNIFILFQLC